MYTTLYIDGSSDRHHIDWSRNHQKDLIVRYLAG